MINDNQFTLQPETWIASVLTCLAGFVSLWLEDTATFPDKVTSVTDEHAVPDELGRRIFVELHPMWTSLWNRIDDIPHQTPKTLQRTARPIFESLVCLVSDSIALYKVLGMDSAAFLQLDLIPVLLFAWTHATIHGTQANPKLAQVPALLHEHLHLSDTMTRQRGHSNSLARLPVPPTPWGGKVDPAIAHIGAPRVIEAFRLALQENPGMVDERLHTCIRVLNSLTADSVASAMPFRNALWESAMPHSLAEALRRQVQYGHVGSEDYREHIMVCWAACDLLNAAGEGVEKGICPSTNGRDVMAVLELCHICALHGIRLNLKTRKHSQSYSDTKKFITSLKAVTRRWGRFAADRFEHNNRGKLGHNGNVQRMVKQMRGFSQEFWFANMQRLLAPLKELREHAEYHTIVDSWGGLGKAVNVGLEKEREKHDARTARLCSWRECSFYRVPSKKEPQACKGCHETRYCSRECQQIDWTQGGHRKKCKYRVKGEET